jgi:3-hydroxyisobutyrate dehydrogenase-like beta-hydroxyacid dehydrogenase
MGLGREKVMKNEHIAVLGLGIIGSIWARHFEAGGRLAAAWNRTPQPNFPCWVDEPTAAVECAGAILIVLSDPPAVEALLDRIESKLGPEHLVIQSTTIDPASSQRFSQRVRGTGAAYVEAPFTGSKPAAEAKKVVFYLGGESPAVAAAEGFLHPISEVRLPIGSCGQAASLKLAMNLQIALQAGALCESWHLAREAGIGEEVFFGALRKNAACSGVTVLKEPKLRAGDFSPQFSIKHMLKDIRLLLGIGNESLFPLAASIQAGLARAAESGYADEDFIAMMKNFD